MGQKNPNTIIPWGQQSQYTLFPAPMLCIEDIRARSRSAAKSSKWLLLSLLYYMSICTEFEVGVKNVPRGQKTFGQLSRCTLRTRWSFTIGVFILSPKG